jgi:hypothetical protein
MIPSATCLEIVETFTPMRRAEARMLSKRRPGVIERVPCYTSSGAASRRIVPSEGPHTLGSRRKTRQTIDHGSDSDTLDARRPLSDRRTAPRLDYPTRPARSSLRMTASADEPDHSQLERGLRTGRPFRRTRQHLRPPPRCGWTGLVKRDDSPTDVTGWRWTVTISSSVICHTMRTPSLASR